MIDFLRITGFDKKLDNDLRDAFDDVLHSGTFVNGEFVTEFEKLYSEFNGSKYCVSCGNGLDALTIILKSLRLKKNSKILVPAQTFIATYFSVLQAGLVPVPVDVNLDDCLISLDDAQRKMTDEVTALVFVNLYGFTTDPSKIQSFCDRNNIKLVFDSAQSHLTEYDNIQISSYGTHAVSFYPGKNLGALGDGGAILTNDENIKDFAEIYKNYGSRAKYVHDIEGTNSRLDDIQAAFLLKKLKYIENWTSIRRSQANLYLDKIKNSKVLLPNLDLKLNPSWHIFPIRVDNRSLFQSHMQSLGVQTLIHYPFLPIHSKALEQLEFKKNSFVNSISWENTEVSIPIGPHLSSNEIDTIIDAVNNF